MALELVIGEVCEGCEEFHFQDATGAYDVTTNPTGYGSANGVDSPSSFDSYILEIRYPGTPITSDPDATYDLLTAVPSPDSDFFFTWTITIADLGLTKLVSGVWTFTAVGTLAGNSYIADSQCIFKNDLQGVIDTAMLNWDPTCACAPGCDSLATLYTEFVTVVCGGKCDRVATQSIITSLYANSPCGC